MKTMHTAALSLLLAATLCVGSACDPKEEAPPPAPVVPAAPVHAPTAERLMVRAQERWDKGVKSDWVATYTFSAPEVKREQPLATYLAGMSIHKYENMRPVEVLSVSADKAYVRTAGLWTPIAPQVQRVKLEPGQSLTQDIEMIETWRWVDGDWYFVRPQRDTDFYAEHPDLLKATPPAEEVSK
ncbi:MAG: hypothetical protein JNL28_07280 [Planctomycetes bacterium]|nr:hypothetical protein [Planctomycetota bacterium]